MQQLIIVPEFQYLTIPMTTRKLNRLKKNILEEGCRESILIWNGIIIDGHKRYEICQKYRIDYSVKEMIFHSKEEAIIYICKKRIPETKRGSAIYKYLIGKEYQNEKALKNMMISSDGGPDQLSSVYFQKDSTISRNIAENYKINRCTVKKYSIFTQKMDEIRAKSFEFFSDVISEKIKASHETIVEAAEWDSLKLDSFLLEKKHNKPSYCRKKEGIIEIKDEPKETFDVMSDAPLSFGIKEMPPFDPDMELKGLALTIPTWINSIERAVSKTNLDLVSAKTLLHVTNALQKLEWQILLTRESLEK